MTLKPLGDSAWLVEFPGLSGETALARVTGLVEALKSNRPAGVLDVVPSFASVAVHFGVADGVEVREWIGSVTVKDQLPAGEEKRISVCYGGEWGRDLEEVAERVGLSTEEVIALHSGAAYTVAAVGFSPGFPYLLGLPERLNVPRRSTPRLAVPAGSVAVAGGQAGIYPFTSPGGWHVLGRVGETLFDPLAVRPAMLQPGDRVRFVPVSKIEPVQVGRSLPAVELTSSSWIEVISPGGLTTVQDLGRPGHESSGVSPGGAVDRHALRLANLLVGNDEDAAALELCVRGPVLKFHGAATVALTGSSGKPRRVADGETVDFANLPGGVRAYLSVAGGIRVDSVLGSAATDVRAGFGGRTLKAGDRLTVGNPGSVPPCGDWFAGRAENFKASEIELRFVQGAQENWFSTEALRRFRETAYQLTPNSDRVGARLAGADLELAEPREMVSQPVACGSVQVPPDGQPIILLAERQTIGGYPQIGHVISVDLPKLARAWPGTILRFREITLETAWKLRQREERDFKWLRTGLKLLK
ncbi:MAG: 5-oxoprolinase subunit PxpB [Luteolibacter sp.]|uniref:5-oxoprolinase subunit PxpB n=1 Tax=Luteolibacter sp. TaxID=1962973 RepID=UPI003263C720